MSGLGGMWLVARRELRERGRSKAFIISCAITLLVVVAGLILPRVLGGDPTTYQIGVIGDGNQEIIAAAQSLADAEAAEAETEPDRFEAVPFAEETEARPALAAGEVEVVLIGGTEVLQERAGFEGSGLVGRLQRAASSVRLQQLVEENGEAAADVIAILSSSPLEETTLGGEDPAADVRPVIAYGGLLLMYLAILSYGAWTLTGVTEEKNNRVVEVLLATLRPWQLLAGKVLGIGMLGVFQFTLTVGVTFAVIRLSDLVDIPALPASTIWVLVLWFVLGFAVYSVSYAAAGSLTSRPEDAQTASFPLTMLAVAGFFVSLESLNDPTSTLARITSFIPFTAPYVVPIRSSLDGIGPVEHLLSVLVLIAATVLLVRLAARIYAGGLLRFGARTKIKEAWRARDI
ncbi:MAG TPA: ABC transporter permease [Acidimicrobiia bacterium]